MPPSHVPISVNNSRKKAITTTDINRFGGYYSQDRSYSPARIAEAVDCYHMFQLQNYRPPTIREFMLGRKISKAKISLKMDRKILRSKRRELLLKRDHNDLTCKISLIVL